MNNPISKPSNQDSSQDSLGVSKIRTTSPYSKKPGTQNFLPPQSISEKHYNHHEDQVHSSIEIDIHPHNIPHQPNNPNFKLNRIKSTSNIVSWKDKTKRYKKAIKQVIHEQENLDEFNFEEEDEDLVDELDSPTLEHCSLPGIDEVTADAGLNMVGNSNENLNWNRQNIPKSVMIPDFQEPVRQNTTNEPVRQNTTNITNNIFYVSDNSNNRYDRTYNNLDLKNKNSTNSGQNIYQNFGAYAYNESQKQQQTGEVRQIQNSFPMEILSSKKGIESDKLVLGLDQLAVHDNFINQRQINSISSNSNISLNLLNNISPSNTRFADSDGFTPESQNGKLSYNDRQMPIHGILNQYQRDNTFGLNLGSNMVSSRSIEYTPGQNNLTNLGFMMPGANETPRNFRNYVEQNQKNLDLKKKITKQKIDSRRPVISKESTPKARGSKNSKNNKKSKNTKFEDQVENGPDFIERELANHATWVQNNTLLNHEQMSKKNTLLPAHYHQNFKRISKQTETGGSSMTVNQPPQDHSISAICSRLRKNNSAPDICKINFKSDLHFDMISERPEEEEVDTPQVESPLKPLHIDMKGLKSNQILKTIDIFAESTKGKLSAKEHKTMYALAQEMLNFVEENHNDFKRHQGESVAICMQLLIGSKLGLSRRDFLEAWRPMKRKLFKSIESIKTSRCYLPLKSAFGKIWNGFSKKMNKDNVLESTKVVLSKDVSTIHRSRTLDDMECSI